MSQVELRKPLINVFRGYRKLTPAMESELQRQAGRAEYGQQDNEENDAHIAGSGSTFGFGKNGNMKFIFRIP